jgi:hypothetical protein
MGLLETHISEPVVDGGVFDASFYVGKQHLLYGNLLSEI